MTTPPPPPPDGPDPAHAADGGHGGHGGDDQRHAEGHAEGLGLRERKKRATRQAMRDAALDLVSTHGLDTVTVDQVCEVVGVSSRTFFNYFPSKEDALVGSGPVAPDDRALAPFEAGEPTGRLIHDLGLVLAAHLATRVDTTGDLARRHAVMHHEPQLQSRFRANLHAVEDRLALAVARRTGNDPDDHRVRLLVGVVSLAIGTAMKGWSGGGGATPVRDHVEEVFDLLDAALDTDVLLGDRESTT